MLELTPEQKEKLEKKLAAVKAYSDAAKSRTTQFPGIKPIGSFAEAQDPESESC